MVAVGAVCPSHFPLKVQVSSRVVDIVSSPRSSIPCTTRWCNFDCDSFYMWRFDIFHVTCASASSLVHDSSSRQNLPWLVSPKSQNYSIQTSHLMSQSYQKNTNCDLILQLVYEIEHYVLVMSIRDILIAACFDIGLSFISLHLSYGQSNYWYRYGFPCHVRKCSFVFLYVFLYVRAALLKLTTCFIFPRLVTFPYVFFYMPFEVLCKVMLKTVDTLSLIKISLHILRNTYQLRFVSTTSTSTSTSTSSY